MLQEMLLIIQAHQTIKKDEEDNEVSWKLLKS